MPALGGGDHYEETHLGRDVTTLEVVMEAAGLLTNSQLEGLGAPAIQVVALPLVAGLSQLYAAVVVQLFMVVAT